MADTEEVSGGSSAEVKDTEVKEKSEVLSVADTEEVPGTEELPGGSSAEVKDPEIEEKSEVLSVTGTEHVNNASTEQKTEDTYQNSENFEDSEKEDAIIDVVNVINIMPFPDVNCQTSEFCIDNLSPVKEEPIVP